MKGFILTTTGILVPDSLHYSVFEKKEYKLSGFINRSFDNLADKRLEFFRDNMVQFSPIANQLYKEYMYDSSLERLMSMADFMADVLRPISVAEFVKIQAGNRYASNMTLMLLRDLVQRTLASTNHYDSVPPESRFVFYTSITEKESLFRYSRTVKGSERSIKALSWPCILAPLLQEKKPLVTLFKYLFVDKF